MSFAYIVKAEVVKNAVVAQRQMKYASTPNSAAYNVSGKLNIDSSDIIYQEDAPPDLKVVSWPDDRDLDNSDFLKYYAYDKNGGQSSVIYVVENGIDPENEVSTL